MPLTLRELTEIVLQQAREKGWGIRPEEINFGEKIALIHSEVSEAMEAYRKKNMDGKDGVAEELGDAAQRILHLAGIFGIDLEKEIMEKIESNKSRTWDWKKLNESHS